MPQTYQEQFDKRDLHPSVVEVSRGLFLSGHFEQAVTEAFKAVENSVKARSGRGDLYGKNLMATVFSEDDPILQLTALKTPSEKDEQAGFKFIFMGVSLGIRNPRAHETIPQGEASTALDYLTLASLLLRRVETATLTIQADEIVRSIKQKTFVQKPAYLNAMLDKISPHLYVECARQLIAAATDKASDGRVRDNAVFAFTSLVQRLEAVPEDLRATAELLEPILDSDATFDVGLHLLTPAHVPLLASHIREKAFALMVEDLKNGRLAKGLPYGSQFWIDLIRLRQVVPPHCVPDIWDALQGMLKGGDWSSQGFAARMLHELRDLVPPDRLPSLMQALMRPLVWDTSFSAMEEVTRCLQTYDASWITAFVEALAREQGQDKHRLRWMKDALQNDRLPSDLAERLGRMINAVQLPDDEIPF